MLIHEGAHFVGGTNEINHFAMEFPALDGQPQGRGHTRNYKQLLTDEAMKNASSYAAFAIHAAFLKDHRFVQTIPPSNDINAHFETRRELSDQKSGVVAPDLNAGLPRA